MEFSPQDAQVMGLALVEALGQMAPLEAYAYHNSAHTRDMYGRAQRLCRRMGLEPWEAAEVAVAAAFHDTGFLDQYADNEAFGAQRAKAWLADKWPTDRSARVEAMILATCLGRTPVTPQEKALRDADLDNLGRPDFFEKAAAVRAELEKFGGVAPDDAEWGASIATLLRNHRWWTQAAAKDRQEGLEANRGKAGV